MSNKNVGKAYDTPGVVEHFLAARVADAIEAFDSALPRGSFKIDPAGGDR
jgi:hypothetical protein